MSTPDASEAALLKSLLEPLLDDFQHWFGRSRNFLESTVVNFLEPDAQADLLQRVIQSQQEVTAAQTLFQATNGTVGVDPAAMVPWHRLVHECWGVFMRHRAETNPSEDPSS